MESGIRTFEQEFGLDIVLHDGRTVGEHILPRLAAGDRTIKLLPAHLGEVERRG